MVDLGKKKTWTPRSGTPIGPFSGPLLDPQPDPCLDPRLAPPGSSIFLREITGSRFK